MFNKRLSEHGLAPVLFLASGLAAVIIPLVLLAGSEDPMLASTAGSAYERGSVSAGADPYPTVENAPEEPAPPILPDTSTPGGDGAAAPEAETILATQTVPADASGPDDDETGEGKSFDRYCSREFDPASPVIVWCDRADGDYVTGDGSGAISGRVTDPWGNGIAGIKVALNYRPSFCRGKCAPSIPIPVAITDSEGHYTISASDIEGPGPPTLYFYDTLYDYDVTERYRAEYYDQGSLTGVPAGSSGVDVVMIPVGSFRIGESESTAREDVIHIVFRSDSPEPADGESWAFDEGLYKLLSIPVYTGVPNPETWGYRWPLYEATWLGGHSWESAAPFPIHDGIHSQLNVGLSEADLGDILPGTIFGNVIIWTVTPPPGTQIILVHSDDADNVIAEADLSYERFSFSFSGLTTGSYKLGVRFPQGIDWWSGRAYSYADWPNSHSWQTPTSFDNAKVIDIVWPTATSAALQEDTVSVECSTVEGTATIRCEARHRRSVRYEAAGPLTVQVFPEGGRISGRLVRADGSAVGGEIVWPEGGEYYNSDRTDSGGYFSIVDLKPGTYAACVTDHASNNSRPYDEYCSEPFTVDWFETLTGIDILVPDHFGIGMDECSPTAIWCSNPQAAEKREDPYQPVTAVVDPAPDAGSAEQGRVDGSDVTNAETSIESPAPPAEGDATPADDGVTEVLALPGETAGMAASAPGEEATSG